jgi:hypothetical protein
MKLTVSGTTACRKCANVDVSLLSPQSRARNVIAAQPNNTPAEAESAAVELQWKKVAGFFKVAAVNY